jgi:Na+-translocating ferredoxin:NAD+ oxidoreductase RnfA subunit
MILQYFGISRLLFLVALVCVAGLVQIAEFTTKKLAPRFYLEIGYFMPILACNLFLLLLPTSFAGLRFGEMLLSVISNGLGIWLVLSIIAGIKQNYFEKADGAINSNVASLIVVFILIVIWTAF